MLINSISLPVAKYIYDSFGNTLSSGGPLADANLYRFSSKEYHSGSGLYSFGFRFFEPSLQRWSNRDPIEEEGGLNLYSFVGNRPVSKIDSFGLVDVVKTSDGFIIEVGRCEIVRHIGHGNKKGWPKFFCPKDKIGDCPAAAGFIGCYASEINQGIPKKGVQVIPGCPTDSAGGVWDGVVSPFMNGPDWTTAIKSSDDGIKSLVNDWLKNKSKCCPSVKVSDVDDTGKITTKTYTKPIP